MNYIREYHKQQKKFLKDRMKGEKLYIRREKRKHNIIYKEIKNDLDSRIVNMMYENKTQDYIPVTLKQVYVGYGVTKEDIEEIVVNDIIPEYNKNIPILTYERGIYPTINIDLSTIITEDKQ